VGVLGGGHGGAAFAGGIVRVAGGGVADYGDGADGHVGVDVGHLVALEAAAEAHFCWWRGEGEGVGCGGVSVGVMRQMEVVVEIRCGDV